MLARMLTVRDARPDDYAAFQRLFPELAVDDPLASEERFAREMVPLTVIAEREGRVVGYALYQILEDAAYVRHLVVDPGARRAGIGRALLLDVATRARAAGATDWILNVKPDNVPAIALYESLGFRRTHQMHALRMDWSRVAEAARRARDAAPEVTVSAAGPEEDATLEAAAGLLRGQIGAARAMGAARIGLAARTTSGEVLAVGVFDPGFPGIHPFRARSGEAALLLVDAASPHKRPEHDHVNLALENAPAVAEALLARGAVLRLLVQNMRGPLPPIP